MRTLKQLTDFLHLDAPQKNGELELTRLVTDSRQAGPGTIFIARKGTHVDGRTFIGAAFAQGAAAVVLPHGQGSAELLAEHSGAPIYELPEIISEAEFVAWFYGYPSDRMTLIGVTGTNGKTTVTQLVAQWYALRKMRCGIIGTLGTGFPGELTKSPNTTPDVYALGQILADISAAGAQKAVMEVSSIGIAEGRIDRLNFNCGAFTNLTRDHLDYHGTMENYLAAKEVFISAVHRASRRVFCVDDPTAAKLALKYQGGVAVSLDPGFKSNLVRYAISGWVWIREYRCLPHGTHVVVESSFGEGECDIRLLGTFNVENFACALGIMLAMGERLEPLLACASELKPVRGRMEAFRAPDQPTVIVDYAHTPDGVEQALRAAREHHPGGKIICVLGCGGDRDRGKRPIMAIKACVHADQVIFTSDNPRSEDPQAILQDMVNGVGDAHNHRCIVDRAEAIAQAFAMAAPGDCVLIAGKGHEDYQIFADRTVHFSDREQAAKLLGVALD